MSDLAEFYDRLDYLHSEQIALRNSIAAFSRSSIEMRAVPGQRTKYQMEARLRDPLPISLRSKVGMMINETRVILDNLANTLAVRNGKTNSATVYFPISKNRAVFEQDGVRKMRDLSARDQQTVASFNPYGGGNNLLYFLHELDIKRKHLKLGAQGGALGYGTFPVAKDGYFDFKNPGILGSDFAPFAWFNDPNCKTMTFELMVAIVDPPIVENSDVVGLLEFFSAEVRKIVQAFEP